jgi:hypothetical protein
VTVAQAHLLGKAMPAEVFIELEKTSGLKELTMFAERQFPGLQEVRYTGRETEVELARLSDALHRSEKEDPVFEKWSAQVSARIPSP